MHIMPSVEGNDPKSVISCCDILDMVSSTNLSTPEQSLLLDALVAMHPDEDVVQ
jgi:hypothetical protein